MFFRFYPYLCGRTMSISRTLLHDISHLLTTIYSPGEASAVARLLLSRGVGWGTVAVFTGKDSDLSTDERRRLRDFLHRLLDLREPVQYVLGEAPFCGRDFVVRPGVLIPRPETEQLLEMLKADGLPDGKCPPRLLDVGTGSGCIAVTMALLFPSARVEAWDISEAALQVARENARRHGVEVAFRRCDLLQEAAVDAALCDRSAGAFAESAGTFAEEARHFSGASAAGGAAYAALVSNPPYVLPSEEAAMQPEVCKWEPREALFVPADDPLLPYRALCRIGRKRLADGGKMYLEINPLLAAQVEELLRDAGFGEVRLVEDFAKKQRFIIGTNHLLC